MFFLRKRREERRRWRGAILAFAEHELGDLLRPFPKVYIEVRHEKEQSVFLIHQKRGQGEEDLHSFAWMRIIWGPRGQGEESVIFSTREIAPEVRVCSTAHIYDAIREVVEFLEKHNTPGALVFEMGE